MPATLDTLRILSRRRAVRAAALLLPAVGVAAGGLPLLDAPGYELAELCALLATLGIAPWLGLAAARIERSRPGPSPAAAFGAAAIAGTTLLGLLALGEAARAALGPCRVLPSAGFVPALLLPALLLSTATAVAAGFLARGRRAPAVALYAGAVAASLAVTLRSAYLGPAAWAYDPFLGYFPGPLYDELLRVDARLLRAAAATAAWAVAVAAVAEALVARSRTALALALAAAVAASGIGVARRARGETRSPTRARAAVTAALGGSRAGPRCTVHFAADRPAAAADELLSECEFQVADVARLLGIAAPPRVTVFLYRSPAEKRRLVGAAGTEFTKPWLAEIHLGDAPLPHPVLRHEVVHAVASALAPGPLHVPARAGVLVSMGLVEGLAVALETPRGAWTVHEWSRAARDQGLLPDVARFVGPAGFWAQAPARAYTAAGSFVAFLLERHGPAPLRAAYASGDLAGALGQPLPALIDAWQRFLDEVPVPPGLAGAARARMGRPSVFGRRCTREAAALEADAALAAAAGRTGEACALYDRSAALSGSAWDLKARADVLARTGALGPALEAYRDAARRAPAGEAALRGALAAAEGDLAWRRGDLPAALAGWDAALAAGPDRAEVRLLLAKRVAALDPALGPAVQPYLLALEPAGPALERLGALPQPLAAYLVGRARAAGGEHAAAAAALSIAAAGDLPAPLHREAALGLGEARCLSGAPAAGEAALRALLADAQSAAERARIEASLRRCEWGAAGRAAPRGP